MSDRSSLAVIRRVAGMAAITALLTTMAAPAFAASSNPPPSSPFAPAAVARVVAKTVDFSDASLKTVPVTVPTKAKAAKQPQGSFIKSRVGLMVIAAFAVGTGYAIYSAKEDRIRGLNR